VEQVLLRRVPVLRPHQIIIILMAIAYLIAMAWWMHSEYDKYKDCGHDRNCILLATQTPGFNASEYMLEPQMPRSVLER